MRSDATSIDGYPAGLSPDKRALVSSLRDLVRAHLALSLIHI